MHGWQEYISKWQQKLYLYLRISAEFYENSDGWEKISTNRGLLLDSEFLWKKILQLFNRTYGECGEVILILLFFAVDIAFDNTYMFEWERDSRSYDSEQRRTFEKSFFHNYFTFDER